MPKAARIDDTIAHTGAFEGMLTGLALGLVVGAFAVATGGAGLLFVCAAAATGARWGRRFGSLFTHNSGLISTGADTVRIGRRWAARAVDDKVNCHDGKVIAQGSRIVIIEDFPASRIGDKTTCDGTISSGSANVEIGLEAGTYAEIGSEIPLELELAVEVLGLVGSFRGKSGKGKSKKSKGKTKSKRRSKSKTKKSKPQKKKSNKKSKSKNKSKKKRPKSKKRTAKKSKPKRKRGKPKKQKKNKTSKKKAGKSSKAPKKNKKCESDPVDIAAGAVIDSSEDLELFGLIPVRWVRHYDSDADPNDGPLGAAGWTHDLDQWIIEDEEVFSLRAEEGRDIYFARVQIGESTFHRAERQTLTVLDFGGFRVYDHTNRLVRVFEPLEPGGRAYLRQIADNHGNHVDLYYGGTGLERIIDTAGRNVAVVSDSLGRITRLEVLSQDELLQWVDYQYHPTGELASATDALGHAEQYEYDDQRCLIQKTLPNGTNFYYEYDEEDGRCVGAWGDGGLHAKELEYDDEEQTTTVHGDVESRFYEWNDDGAVLREATFEGDDLHLVEFDEDGFVIAEGTTDETLTRYEYDARGNRTKSIDPAGNVTEWVYSDNELPTHRKDPDNLVTEFRHDERGNLTSIRYPAGVEVTLSYDTHGRISVLREGDVTLLETTYDAQHNILSECDARGSATVYEHDGMGRPTTRTDALGRTTRVECDLLGRVLRHIAPDGATTEFAYDALGNVTQSTDALGQTARLEYAGTGVLSRLVGPDGEAWAVHYDGDERITEIQNPALESYVFEYSEAGHVVAETTFDGRRLAYRYDDEGLLSSIDYPDGTFRSFEYDVLGNIIKETSALVQVEFERDELGRLERAELAERSGKVVTELRRDEFGRVIEEIQNGHSIRYVYDNHGRRIERMLPDGATTRYGYDAGDGLAYLEHDGGRFTLDRDVLGRETAMRALGSGVEIRSAYDEMDRLVERHVAGGAAHAALSRRTWKYDVLGRVREIGDSRWGTTSYQYDSIGQLIEARRGAYREVFQYDITGSLRNILRDLTQVGHAHAWKTETGNRLTHTETARYEYDACGRLVKKVGLVDTGGERAGAVTTYLWDERERLREVNKPDGTQVLFTYDAFGRRVRKDVLPAEGETARRIVEFLWDGDELAADLDSRRGVRVFVHEPGTFVPILQAEQGEVLVVVNDHLGMPKELIDQDGRTAWSAAHSAWGKVVEEYRDPSARRRRPAESPFRLLGQYADEETGLCYTRFRYFDAEVGRWCSPDPLGLLGGENLYQYNGSPTIDIDPLGLACRAAWKGIGATGKLGEKALKKLGGQSQVFFPTALGSRFVDRLHKSIARESKVGYMYLTKKIARQILKDAELIAFRDVKGAAWYFYKSPVTGQIGPSPPLREALKEAGIKIIIVK